MRAAWSMSSIGAIGLVQIFKAVHHTPTMTLFVAGISDLMLIQGRLLLYEDSCMWWGWSWEEGLYLCPGYLFVPPLSVLWVFLPHSLHWTLHYTTRWLIVNPIIYMIVIPYYNLSTASTHNYIVSRNVEIFDFFFKNQKKNQLVKQNIESSKNNLFVEIKKLKKKKENCSENYETTSMHTYTWSIERPPNATMNAPSNFAKKI